MHSRKKGFTLIEMLLVIAIIAVLISVLTPVLIQNTKKAKAAADAANLKNILGIMNVELSGQDNIEEIVKNVPSIESQYAKNAVIRILYTRPCFVDAYFVDADGHYYGTYYLAEVATDGKSNFPVSKPVSLGEWYEAGTGKIIDPETGE